MSELLVLLVCGAGAGFIGAMLGVGGGIIIVPVAVLVLGLPIHHAIATSLLAVIATSSSAASKNIRLGLANLRLGISLEVATVVGALTGSVVAGLLARSTLELIFGVAMAAMAIPMAMSADVETQLPSGEVKERSRFLRSLDGSYEDRATGSVVTYIVRRFPVAVSVSSFAGVLSGLLGVGGGIIKVPLMSLVCGVPMKAAAATSNFMIGVTALASAMIFYGRGQVETVATAAIVLGVFAGAKLGTIGLGRMHTRHLRRLFAVLMVIVAIEMILQSQGVRFP